MNLLLVDINNLIYRTIYTLPNLKFENRYTGGVYGTLNILSKAIISHRPKVIIICDDAPPYKKSLQIKYKSNRVKDLKIYKKVRETKEYCKKIFKYLNIPYFKTPGYEADDLIAQIVKNYEDKFDKIFVLSNDSDLYQLFSHENISFIHKDQKIFNKENFQALHPEIKNFPCDWIHYLILTGGHNGLGKIKGIGDKKAKEIIKSKTISDYFSEEEKAKLYNLTKVPFDNKSLSRDKKTILDNYFIREKRSAENFLVEQMGIVDSERSFSIYKMVFNLGNGIG